jgi:hypothetical protein
MVIVSAILFFALQIVALNVRLAAREFANRSGDAARRSPGASAPAQAAASASAQADASSIRPSRPDGDRSHTDPDPHADTSVFAAVPVPLIIPAASDLPTVGALRSASPSRRPGAVGFHRLIRPPPAVRDFLRVPARAAFACP